MHFDGSDLDLHLTGWFMHGVGGWYARLRAPQVYGLGIMIQVWAALGRGAADETLTTRLVGAELQSCLPLKVYVVR